MSEERLVVVECSGEPVTVHPSTPVRDAFRMARERGDELRYDAVRDEVVIGPTEEANLRLQVAADRVFNDFDE